MIDLPPRKFDLGESVWAEVGKSVHHATIWGCEDGRRLSRRQQCLGWAYHVTLHGAGGKELGNEIVGEENLKRLSAGYEHAT